MKKSYICAALLLFGALAFTSCSDDRDSNPVLYSEVATFQLNTPAVGEAEIDMAKTSSVDLTWSQPQFTNPNAPVAAKYEVEISSTGKFAKQYVDAEDADNTGADYMKLGDIINSCKTSLTSDLISKNLQILNDWDETTLPSAATAYFRVRAYLEDQALNVVSSVYSSVVKLNVIPAYVELRNADPEFWWLIGGDICDGKWGSDVAASVIPLQVVDGAVYDKKTGQGEISWTGYLAGNGFKLRGSMTDGWATQWGQGDAFGSYVKNDGGSANITVPAAGYYTVTLNTATDVLSITEYTETPKTFTSMCVSGSMNEWGDEPMSPAFTYTGAINHDWYITMTFDGNTEFKFKEAGSWDYNTGGPLNTMNNGDCYGYGTNNGSNMKPEAGKYLIIYNDITRYYRLIKQ